VRLACGRELEGHGPDSTAVKPRWRRA
jgi:hypothetical protein